MSTTAPQSNGRLRILPFPRSAGVNRRTRCVSSPAHGQLSSFHREITLVGRTPAAARFGWVSHFEHPMVEGYRMLQGTFPDPGLQDKGEDTPGTRNLCFLFMTRNRQYMPSNSHTVSLYLAGETSFSSHRSPCRSSCPTTQHRPSYLVRQQVYILSLLALHATPS